MMVPATGAMLAAATLLSEDAATLAAGTLVAAKAISPAAAIAWVALGIWVGDLGLFAVGRLARGTPAVASWIDRRWSLDQVRAMEARFSRGAAIAILGSRFLPGTRVLLYVAAGLFDVRPSTFAWLAAIASVMWTAVVVAAVGLVGRSW